MFDALVRFAEYVRPVVQVVVPTITLAAAAAGWWKARQVARRQEEMEQQASQAVSIRLHLPTGEFVTLPYAPRRSQLGRSELLGVLGMFARGGKFNLPRLPELFTSGAFEDALSGRTDMLTVEVGDEGVEAFAHLKG